LRSNFPTAFWQKAGEKRFLFPKLFSRGKKGFCLQRVALPFFPKAFFLQKERLKIAKRFWFSQGFCPQAKGLKSRSDFGFPKAFARRQKALRRRFKL